MSMLKFASRRAKDISGAAATAPSTCTGRSVDELPLPPLHAPDRQILSAAVFTDAAIEKDVNALKHHACDSPATRELL